MKPTTILVTILVAVLLGIQVIPVERSNPPVRAEIEAPAQVAAILERACYNCHSHETRWPWYGYVAPVSWVVASDVARARTKLNFSEWGQLDSGDREDLLEEIWEETSEGEMPPRAYRLFHPDARLSEQDLAILREWIGPVAQEDEPEERFFEVE